MPTKYFKLHKDCQHYRGERYFKVNFDQDKAIQVCVDPGMTKKGKTNTKGIYAIERVTFLTNYLGYGAIPCTKAEYTKQFKKVVRFLK